MHLKPNFGFEETPIWKMVNSVKCLAELCVYFLSRTLLREFACHQCFIFLIIFPQLSVKILKHNSEIEPIGVPIVLILKFCKFTHKSNKSAYLCSKHAIFFSYFSHSNFICTFVLNKSGFLSKNCNTA